MRAHARRRSSARPIARRSAALSVLSTFHMLTFLTFLPPHPPTPHRPRSKRSFSIAIQCPTSGATTGQAVFPTTITDLGNCAYATTMVHPAACPALGRGTGGWNLSSTFWFLVFSGFTVYFVGGMAFRYKQLGMTGMDMIPHLDFWRELPGRLWVLGLALWEKLRDMLNSVSGGKFGAGGRGDERAASCCQVKCIAVLLISGGPFLPPFFCARRGYHAGAVRVACGGGLPNHRVERGELVAAAVHGLFADVFFLRGAAALRHTSV